MDIRIDVLNTHAKLVTIHPMIKKQIITDRQIETDTEIQIKTNRQVQTDKQTDIHTVR